MEARPCQILEFFDGTKQLLVPLFQRPYEWGTKEWEVLWADLLEQYEHTEEEAIASHWPAPGSEDTELGAFMEPEVSHGETTVYARVQA